MRNAATFQFTTVDPRPGADIVVVNGARGRPLP